MSVEATSSILSNFPDPQHQLGDDPREKGIPDLADNPTAVLHNRDIRFAYEITIRRAERLQTELHLQQQRLAKVQEMLPDLKSAMAQVRQERDSAQAAVTKREQEHNSEVRVLADQMTEILRANPTLMPNIDGSNVDVATLVSQLEDPTQLEIWQTAIKKAVKETKAVFNLEISRMNQQSDAKLRLGSTLQLKVADNTVGGAEIDVNLDVTELQKFQDSSGEINWETQRDPILAALRGLAREKLDKNLELIIKNQDVELKVCSGVERVRSEYNSQLPTNTYSLEANIDSAEDIKHKLRNACQQIVLTGGLEQLPYEASLETVIRMINELPRTSVIASRVATLKDTLGSFDPNRTTPRAFLEGIFISLSGNPYLHGLAKACGLNSLFNEIYHMDSGRGVIVLANELPQIVRNLSTQSKLLEQQIIQAQSLYSNSAREISTITETSNQARTTLTNTCLSLDGIDNLYQVSNWHGRLISLPSPRSIQDLSDHEVVFQLRQLEGLFRFFQDITPEIDQVAQQAFFSSVRQQLDAQFTGQQGSALIATLKQKRGYLREASGLNRQSIARQEELLQVPSIQLEKALATLLRKRSEYQQNTASDQDFTNLKKAELARVSTDQSTFNDSDSEHFRAGLVANAQIAALEYPDQDIDMLIAALQQQIAAQQADIREQVTAVETKIKNLREAKSAVEQAHPAEQVRAVSTTRERKFPTSEIRTDPEYAQLKETITLLRVELWQATTSQEITRIEADIQAAREKLEPFRTKYASQRAQWVEQAKQIVLEKNAQRTALYVDQNDPALVAQIDAQIRAHLPSSISNNSNTESPLYTDPEIARLLAENNDAVQVLQEQTDDLTVLEKRAASLKLVHNLAGGYDLIGLWNYLRGTATAATLTQEYTVSTFDRFENAAERQNTLRNFVLLFTSFGPDWHEHYQEAEYQSIPPLFVALLIAKGEAYLINSQRSRLQDLAILGRKALTMDRFINELDSLAWLDIGGMKASEVAVKLRENSRTIIFQEHNNMNYAALLGKMGLPNNEALLNALASAIQQEPKLQNLRNIRLLEGTIDQPVRTLNKLITILENVDNQYQYNGHDAQYLAKKLASIVGDWQEQSTKPGLFGLRRTRKTMDELSSLFTFLPDEFRIKEKVLACVSTLVSSRDQASIQTELSQLFAEGHLLGESTLLGRDNPALFDKNIGERKTSKRHAELKMRNGQLYLTDLDSTNGTWVNEERVPTQLEWGLHDGDVITLAGVRTFLVTQQPGNGAYKLWETSVQTLKRNAPLSN